MYSFKPKVHESFHAWAFFKDAFSSQECQVLRNYFPNNMDDARVEGGDVQEKVRKTSVSWLAPDHESKWIFDRLAKISRSLNDQFFRLQLSGFYEPLQLTKYEQGDFYQWHIDNGNKELSVRKLSIVVQLSDPSEYEGGELQFMGDEGVFAPKDQGTMIVFPSYLGHRVKTVTKGERRSLVAWTSGEPFR